MNSTLRGKCAVVTGSVQGIGLATAHALAKRGVSVMLSDITVPSEIAEIIGSVRGPGAGKVAFMAADLTVEDEIQSLISTAASVIGPPDILVNNAAVRTRDSIEAIAVADWHRAIAVNVTAPFHLIRAALPFMRRRRWGRIVNVASGFGLIGSARRVDYVTTKTALIGLTKAVALDLADTGITCNAVCPGSTWTPRQERRLAQFVKEGLSPDAAYRHLLSTLGARRFLPAESIADAVAYLCGDSAAAITGVALPVDGGDIPGW